MLVAETPLEEQSSALAPAVLLPVALPLGVAAESAVLSLPPDLAPTILQTLPAASSLKPNAALAVSLALHVGLVAGIIGLATSDFSAGEGDIDAIELVVEQAPEEAGATMAQSAAPKSESQDPATQAEPANEPAPMERVQAPEPVAQPAEPPQQTAALASEAAPPPPQILAPAPQPDAEMLLHRRQEEERRAAAETQAKEREEAARRATAARVQEQERRKEAARRAAEREKLEEQRERAAARAAEQAKAREATRAEQRRPVQASLGERQLRSGGERASDIAAPPPAQRARAGDNDGFDAASYRALVARAVRAAVGSRCSQAAGSRVVIALTIGRSGSISSASIASSSGNGAFDAASAAAVRGAGPFPPPTGRSAVSVPVAVSCR